jgi:tight adherence protein B
VGAVAAVAALASGVPVVGFLILPVGPIALGSLVRYRREKQQRLFSQQLAQHLEELASAMRAGHGLVAGLRAMVEAALEPSRSEWARVVNDEQLGKPLDEAMHTLALRMDCYEVDQVALIASLHQRTGGNIAEVLDRVAEGVRERAELRRELQALTAQARLSRWVVTGLPFVLVGVIELVDPPYLRPLFKTTGGHVVLALAAMLLGIGALVMRKLTEIKV